MLCRAQALSLGSTSRSRPSIRQSRDVPEAPREPHGALHRRWHRKRRERLGLQGGRGRGGGGAHREHDIAVEQRAVGNDTPRQRVARRLGQPLKAGAVERRVGRDHGETRVAGPRAERGAPPGEMRQRIHERAVRAARPREDRPRGVEDVADRVQHHQRTDDDVAAARGPGSHAALRGGARPQRLTDGSSRARADRPFRNLALPRRGGASAVRVVRRRPAVRLASGGEIEVEDHRGRHDRHDAGGPHRQTAPAFLEPAHHTIRRAETVGRATGEQDGVDAVDEVAGVQRVELAGSGGAAAHRAGGAHPTVRPEHHGASGRPLEVGPVPHGDASDGGEAGGSGRRHGSAKIARLARVVEGTYVSAMPNPDPQSPPTTGRVVDDEDGIRQALDRFLTRLGYRVLQAASGAEALDRQAAEQPQVMLSDIRMPNMSGVELVPKALAADSDLAIIMLTAIDEPRTAIECLKLGAYDYLIKPVDLDELEMSLQSGLRQRQLEIDRRELEQWLAREVAVRTRDLEERTTVVEDVALTALAAAGDWPGANDAIEKLAKELGTSPDDVTREVRKGSRKVRL